MKKIHFVGIGGIGMSGLASMSKSLNYHVLGSDRGANLPENQKILAPLKNKGIEIFPQDGSYAKKHEDLNYLVYSSAIEKDNLDFLAMPKDCVKLHRSQALQKLIEESNFKNTIAISGSCGKSSVCGLLSETIFSLTEDVNFLNGAIVKSFASSCEAGNFHFGNSNDYFVFEADESDKSLINYTPDYAIVLNIGTDHYSKDELAEVFAKFVNNVKKLAVVSQEVYDLISPKLSTNAKVVTFNENLSTQNAIKSYRLNENSHSMEIQLTDDNIIKLHAPGFHNGVNALAIYVLLKEMGFEPKLIAQAISHFAGVARRFDYIKTTKSGAIVYDDYAHNPEKIISCLKGAREIVKNKIYIIFQPHGYGPLKFMRDELGRVLENNLNPTTEKFIMLEPFYAGGTSSFSPHSIELIEEFQAKSANPEKFIYLNSRDEVVNYLNSTTKDGDIILIMGARDNSLPVFANTL